MDPLELKIRRIRSGMTQYQLAEKAGIHPSRLSEMETGKRPIADPVIEALDRTLYEIIHSGRLTTLPSGQFQLSEPEVGPAQGGGNDVPQN